MPLTTTAVTEASVRRALEGSRRRNVGGRLFQAGLLACLGLSLAFLVVLLITVLTKGLGVFSERGLDFLTSGTSGTADKAGVWQAIKGSFYIGLFVTLLGFPIGVGAAVYLDEYARQSRLTRFININIRNLAGVPSIVYGILGLAIFVKSLGGLTGGRSVIAGGLTLAVLVLPIVIITSGEALRAVPNSIREAGYGVGASRWEVTRSHVLPYAAPGILTGTVLSLARALGEAAPLILVGAVTGFFSTASGAGFVDELQGPFTALPNLAFNWARQPGSGWPENTAAAILVMLVVILGANAAAIVLRNRYDKARVKDEGTGDDHPRLPQDRTLDMTTDTRMKPLIAARNSTEAAVPTTARDRPATVPDPGHGQQAENGDNVDAPPVFDIKDLDVYYGDFRAVRNVELEIAEHEITAFIGPSGCGKTTVLRCLNRMNDLIETARVDGEILYHGVDLYDPKVEAVEVRRRVGMVFQKPNPFPKSIYDNIVFGPRIAGRKDDMDEVVERSLRRAALWDEVKDRLNDSAMGLSGGQQQRLCIARAIAVDPDVLLMDEPCSALDPIATGRIEDLMQEIKDDFTIVIVTHNMQQAARVSDRTAFFTAEVESESDRRTGLLVEFDETDRMFSTPADERTENYVTGRFG